jgi:hypothetical protein
MPAFSIALSRIGSGADVPTVREVVPMVRVAIAGWLLNGRVVQVQTSAAQVQRLIIIVGDEVIGITSPSARIAVRAIPPLPPV